MSDVFGWKIGVKASAIVAVVGPLNNGRRTERHVVNLRRRNVDHLGYLSKRDVWIAHHEHVPVGPCSEDFLQAVFQFFAFLVLGVQSNDSAGKHFQDYRADVHSDRGQLF